MPKIEDRRKNANEQGLVPVKELEPGTVFEDCAGLIGVRMWLVYQDEPYAVFLRRDSNVPFYPPTAGQVVSIIDGSELVRPLPNARLAIVDRDESP